VGDGNDGITLDLEMYCKWVFSCKHLLWDVIRYLGMEIVNVIVCITLYSGGKLCYVKEIQYFNKELFNKNYDDRIEESLFIMINQWERFILGCTLIIDSFHV
jgi:hypothetical protein